MLNSCTRVASAAVYALLVLPAAVLADVPFGVRVVDNETGRGVPLVELRTTNQLRFVTDSAGWAAIDKPELNGQEVFFFVTSHGYEYPADGFGFHGKRLQVEAGKRETLQIKRLNVAERLYRITGEGIYADSVRLGEDVPLEFPLLNAQVSGQDSVQTAIYHDRIWWFWGDTSRLSYPLGHFGTAGATSELPGRGGLDPSVGVNLTYFAGDNGFSRPMFDLGRPGVVWTDAVFTLKDNDGVERLVCHYSRRKGLAEQLEHGLAVLDDERNMFEPLIQLSEDALLFPQGHAFPVRDESGTEYIYFATPYPLVRVEAEWDAVLDLMRYEAWTPVRRGGSKSDLERDADGRLVYDWKPDTPALGPADYNRLIQRGTISADEAIVRTVDAETGDAIQLHGGTVHWNEHRQRWVMIAVQTFGKPSLLGEVWYAEADQPQGPWPRAVKVVSHDDYSFYNPAHHPFFDSKGGRYIYFEGTYTHTFSGNKDPTPRYDYNQIMYRLDLDAPELSVLR